MKNKNLRLWIPVIVAVAFVAGMATSLWLIKIQGRSQGERKLSTILEMINENYVDHVDTDSLIEKTIPSLLASLDPHSVYIPASSLTKVNDELEGSFSGVGVSFTIQNDTVTIIEVISGGPAEKVGILPGDRIITIDGKPFTGPSITNDSVFSTLRGPANTEVELGIKRNSSRKPLSYTVVRGEIPVTSIDAAYMIADSVGYVKVNKFGRTTFNEFFQSMTALHREGARDFIVDLRGNGGGFMEMAILMANEFLPRGTIIVNTHGRDGRNNEYVAADGNGTFTDAGLTVLIDEYSASASEIFAGAIQDNDRGVIVGRRSFGKGLIQNQTTLPDSSAIRLTVGRYYTPSGRSIQRDYSDASRYSNDLLDRYLHGEMYSADSIKLNTDLKYTTTGGRTVYGGGGIMPDVFVPNDTIGVSKYYVKVADAGLLHEYAFQYCDSHRAQLADCKTVDELMARLPGKYDLLIDFMNYAERHGVPKQWAYVKEPTINLLVNTLTALIARDRLGIPAYYQIVNRHEATVNRAIEVLLDGSPQLNIETPEAE